MLGCFNRLLWRGRAYVDLVDDEDNKVQASVPDSEDQQQEK